MAIVTITEVQGLNTETYDKSVEMVGGKVPPGCLSHAACPMEGGMRIVEVWESQAAYEAFVQGALEQMGQALGVAPPPPPQIWSAHNFMHA